MGNQCSRDHHSGQNINESEGLPFYIQQFIIQIRSQCLKQEVKQELHKLGKSHLYRGDFVGGKKQGYGEYLIRDNGYFGQFHEDLPEGLGILVLDSINFIKGHFKEGKPHGQCRQKVNNMEFIGEYENGERKKGVLKTGQYVYEGEIVKNKMEGLGKIIFHTGEIYEGEFLDGKYDGIGKYKTSKGQYNGHFRLGRYEGKGIYRWQGGEFYEGSYKAGKREGEGRFVKQQFSYDGGWKNGVPTDFTPNGHLICNEEAPLTIERI